MRLRATFTACLAHIVWIVAPLTPAHAQRAEPTSVEAVFARDQLNQFVLDIEAALARAQARYDIIPTAAAQAITASATLDSIPAEELAAEHALVRHRMVALLNVWRRRLPQEAANALHYGATTVDVYDTARMLQVRLAILLTIEDLRAIETDLIALAQAHRDTPMMGRTLGQHALPITFGKKVSVWIGENRRHIARLHDLLARVERSSILKGAVGSYVGLGPDAMAVEAAFAEELGLPEPYIDDWHGARDVFGEYAGVLALISRTYARLGQEVFLLQMTDIGEVVEVRPATAVGSSAMPHKVNPSLSEALVFKGRQIPRLAAIIQDDMINVFERDNTSRTNAVLAEISIETEAMLDNAATLIGRLAVNEEAMRANLDRTDGMVSSQRVVFALAEAMGKTEAEDRVRASAQRALDEAITFSAALLADREIAAHLTAADLEALLDPTTNLGLAAEQVDAVIAAALAERAQDRLPGPARP